ncbi:hypothetical protein [Streptomyces microflavus]|uniref:hypothetical protein n=1 Tax=Streptomyces microflavus TaxID=1919 RepID=UPI0033B3AB11
MAKPLTTAWWVPDEVIENSVSPRPAGLLAQLRQGALVNAALRAIIRAVDSVAGLQDARERALQAADDLIAAARTACSRYDHGGPRTRPTRKPPPQTAGSTWRSPPPPKASQDHPRRRGERTS